MRFCVIFVCFLVSWVFLFGISAMAQATAVQVPDKGVPVYRITVVGRTTKAINYRHRSGATKIDFRGTPLLPAARGEAKVESKQGYIEIEVEFDNLQPASKFGPEFLTYVMWAITPEGRATNLGEILLNGTKSKLNVTTELQAFGLVVTAEPYFAVTQPSDAVVMENVVRRDTLGKIEEIDAQYELLQRGQYTLNVDLSRVQPLAADPRVPLELYQARNAVRIARWTGADRYAAETFAKAERLLESAENYQNRKAGRRPVSMTAREAAQTAEDARIIALRRQEEERLMQERQAAADREARAKAETEAEAGRRTRAEADQRLEAERRARAEAERARAEADRAAAQARQQTAETEAEKSRLAAESSRRAAESSRLAAEEAERLRRKAEQEKAELRANLVRQLNMILETRDTARGLVVNMSDVLFDTGRYTLRPIAREKLARISGIVLANPGLRLEVEGHTDSVGSDQYNQTLSEKRAATVQDYLLGQGLAADHVSARGFGETQPIADNNKAPGRQKNRRVELIVSGEVIGAALGAVKGGANEK